MSYLFVTGDRKVSWEGGVFVTFCSPVGADKQLAQGLFFSIVSVEQILLTNESKTVFRRVCSKLVYQSLNSKTT